MDLQLGIVVAMFYEDHQPPHFHVRYGEHRAIVALESLAVMAGELPPRALGLVTEWAALHRENSPRTGGGRVRARHWRPYPHWSRPMLHDVVEVRTLGGYRLRLRFDDGVEGTIDLAAYLTLDGVFAPLRDPAVFAQVRVHPELGTIVWPSGADLDPDVLHAAVTGSLLKFPADSSAR